MQWQRGTIRYGTQMRRRPGRTMNSWSSCSWEHQGNSPWTPATLMYSPYRRLGALIRARSILYGFWVARRLIAETGADGDLMTAFGAAAAEDGGACLGLHAREEAVGLGAVAAVRLKGTLRHDKNSCGRR